MRHFPKEKVLPSLKVLASIGFVSALLLGWMLTGSTTWAQTPRPTLTPLPTATAGPAPTPDREQP